MVSSLVVEENNSLNVARHFLFSSDLIDQQDSTLLEGVEHHVRQVGDSSGIATAAVASASADHEPVAKVRLASHMGLDFLEDHRQTEEERTSEEFLSE
jgi:hypothetical protein